MPQPKPGEEYYQIYPTPVALPEGSIHNDSGFCYDPFCPCHEDQKSIAELEQHRQNGEVSQEDVTRIYNGKTVW